MERQVQDGAVQQVPLWRLPTRPRPLPAADRDQDQGEEHQDGREMLLEHIQVKKKRKKKPTKFLPRREFDECAVLTIFSFRGAGFVGSALSLHGNVELSSPSDWGWPVGAVRAIKKVNCQQRNK